MFSKNNTRKQILMVMITAVLLTLTVGVASADGFTHAPVFNVDGEAYYMAGAPDGPGGAFDVPGHYWVQAGPNQVVGKHYNTGPDPEYKFYELQPTGWSSFLY